MISDKLTLDSRIKFQCPFSDPEHETPRPYYYGGACYDWVSPEGGGWDVATTYRFGDYIKKEGVLDLNDCPFGTESVVLVNDDGTKGKEFGIDEIAASYRVIDTYLTMDDAMEIVEELAKSPKLSVRDKVALNTVHDYVVNHMGED